MVGFLGFFSSGFPIAWSAILFLSYVFFTTVVGIVF